MQGQLAGWAAGAGVLYSDDDTAAVATSAGNAGALSMWGVEAAAVGGHVGGGGLPTPAATSGPCRGHEWGLFRLLAKAHLGGCAVALAALHLKAGTAATGGQVLSKGVAGAQR